MAIARIQFEFIWVGLVCPVEGERGIILHGNHKYSSVVYIQNFASLFTSVQLLDKVPSILRHRKINVSDTGHMVVNFDINIKLTRRRL